MCRTFAWISLIIAGVLLLLGFIGWAATASNVLIIASRTYLELSQLFALVTIAFLMFQVVKIREAGK